MYRYTQRFDQIYTDIRGLEVWFDYLFQMLPTNALIDHDFGDNLPIAHLYQDIKRIKRIKEL